MTLNALICLTLTEHMKSRVPAEFGLLFAFKLSIDRDGMSRLRVGPKTRGTAVLLSGRGF